MRIRQRFREQPRPVVGGGARENAVVVSRKTLRLHERLPAPVRAAREVRVLRTPAVERLDRGLGDLGHRVNAAEAEVGHLLGMSEGPARIRPDSGVARVRGGRGVPLANGGPQSAEMDLSGESSVPLGAKSSVPGRDGHPHLDRDGRIRAGRRLHHDSAERGHRRVERWITDEPGRHTGWWREPPGRDRSRRRDLRLRQRELGEASARVRLRLCRALGSRPQQRAGHHRGKHIPHAELPSSRGSLLQLLQPVRQQFPFPQVLRHCDGALDFFTCLREPAQLHQQVSANAGKEMVAG